jgi:hypothetical protein
MQDVLHTKVTSQDSQSLIAIKPFYPVDAVPY